MTIKRTINGQEVEIELTGEELWQIYEMHRIENYIEECDAIIPYLAPDDGFGEGMKLFDKDEEFRKEVAEKYGKYWERWVDDNGYDEKLEFAIDALSAVMSERGMFNKEKDGEQTV